LYLYVYLCISLPHTLSLSLFVSFRGGDSHGEWKERKKEWGRHKGRGREGGRGRLLERESGRGGDERERGREWEAGMERERKSERKRERGMVKSME